MISPFEISIGWTGIAIILVVLHARKQKADRRIAQEKYSSIAAEIEVVRAQIIKRKGFLDGYDLESRTLDQALVVQSEINLDLVDQIL